MSDDIEKTPGDDKEREFFVMGNGYGCVRAWQLMVTPDKVVITPAQTAWGYIVVFNGLCLLMMVSFCYLVYWYGFENRKVIGLVVIPLTMLITGAGVTTLTLRKYWSEQRKGPWLVVDRKVRTVSLPREGIEVPIEQVDHLQGISGSAYEESRWSDSDYKSELNIVIFDGQKRKRHRLLNFLGQNEFDGLAAEIAQLNVLPVKRIRSNWDPRRISEKWLTPESKGR